MKNTELEKQSSFNIGDILYSSWGYGQTNIDFFQVVGLTKLGVKIVCMEDLVVEWNNDTWYGKKIPGEPRKHKPMQHKVHNSDYDFGPYISVSSWSIATKWDGKPKTFDQNA